MLDNQMIVTIILLSVFILIYLILFKLYPKYGVFKKLFHNIFKIHVPNFNSYLVYDNFNKIAHTECKYCYKEMIYPNVCEYIVKHDPSKIEQVSKNKYCNICVSNKYKCSHICLLECDHGVCNSCDKCKNNTNTI